MRLEQTGGRPVLGIFKPTRYRTPAVPPPPAPPPATRSAPRHAAPPGLMQHGADRREMPSGNLKPSEATELVRLSPRGQDTMFNAIRTGARRNDDDLRASSTAPVHAEARLLPMPDAPPPSTKADRDLASAFAARVERVAAVLRSGIQENQIVAARKTHPHRAGTLADLRRIEVALRGVAIQAGFLDQAA